MIYTRPERAGRRRAAGAAAAGVQVDRDAGPAAAPGRRVTLCHGFHSMAAAARAAGASLSVAGGPGPAAADSSPSPSPSRPGTRTARRGGAAASTGSLTDSRRARRTGPDH